MTQAIISGFCVFNDKLRSMQKKWTRNPPALLFMSPLPPSIRAAVNFCKELLS